MSSAPYSGITTTFYASPQTKTIGSGSYPFNIVVNANRATLQQVYTKVQYLLRQSTNINTSGASHIGKTTPIMMNFVGSQLVSTIGVFIDNVLATDVNNITLTDNSGVARLYPYQSAGTVTFNSFLVGAGSSYRMLYADDFATTVKDNNGVDITGVVTASGISFSYDYDGNIQGGRTAGTNRAVVLLGINPGFGKYASSTGTLTRTKGISISLVAEQDRSYSA